MKLDLVTEMSILYEISSISVKIINMQKIAEIAVDKSVRLLGTNASIFFLFNEKKSIFEPNCAKGIPLSAISSFHIDELPDNKKIRIISTNPDRLLLAKIIIKPYKAQGGIFLPFYHKERKKHIGFLLVIGFNEKIINQKVFHLLNVLGDRIMNAIENYTLLKEREEALKELEIERKKLEEMNLELQSKNEQIKQINKDLRIKSRTDFLTGLLNRQAIFEYLDREIERSHREHKVFSISMIDIDEFKKINDMYGHDLGDKVLKSFAFLVTNSKLLRKSDITGRFGGDEFIIIFSGTTVDSVKIPLAKLHTQFRQNFFKDEKGNKFHVTFSAGVSEYSDEDLYHEVIKRADQALYQAKKSGRNMICYSE